MRKVVHAPGTGSRADVVEVSEDDFFSYAYERGWTDGLPVIAPTPERVAAMMESVGRSSNELLGFVPPRWGELTVERTAICAVMAGCLPEYFPVVLTAAEAILDESFNLYGVQATTNPVTTVLIINGPIVQKIRIESGSGCMGPGWRANMTIGRAMRLILLNPGGGRPGPIDRATHGFPGKLSFCFAENVAESPWSPLHVDRGFGVDDSVVTAYQGNGSYNILDGVSSKGVDILTTLSHSINAVGTNKIQLPRGEIVIVLAPKHAKIIAQDGFTKEKAQRFIYLNSTARGSDFPPDLRQNLTVWRRDEFQAVTESSVVPIVARHEDILLVVAGGAGNHSVFIPCLGDGRTISRAIRDA